MESRKHSKFRLGIEELESRLTPARLTPIDVPGLEVVMGPHAQVGSAAAHAHARPFHLEESGQAAFTGPDSLSATASGTATHLGKFTLHDTATFIQDGPVLHISGTGVIVAANGDRLFTSFSGSVDLLSGAGTVNFEFTGGDGRFADASGATVWQITLNTADLTYTAVADGVINY